MTETGYHRLANGRSAGGCFAAFHRARNATCFLLLITLSIFGAVFYFYISASTELQAVKNKCDQVKKLRDQVQKELLEANTKAEKLQKSETEWMEKAEAAERKLQELKNTKDAASEQREENVTLLEAKLKASEKVMEEEKKKCASERDELSKKITAIEAKLAEVLANQSKTSVAPNKSAFECKTTSSDATAEPLNAAGVDDQKSTTTPSIAAAATTLQANGNDAKADEQKEKEREQHDEAEAEDKAAESEDGMMEKEKEKEKKEKLDEADKQIDGNGGEKQEATGGHSENGQAKKITALDGENENNAAEVLDTEDKNAVVFNREEAANSGVSFDEPGGRVAMEEARRKAQLHEKEGEQLVDAAAKDAKNEDEAAKDDPASANDATEKTTAKLDGEETGADEVTENQKAHEDAR